MDSAIGLIKAALANNVKVEHVFVDTVGKPEKYQEYLKSIFPNLNITVAKKADSTYPIVSAASICAKVTRDHALKVWKFTEGVEVKEFGSGYPGGKYLSIDVLKLMLVVGNQYDIILLTQLKIAEACLNFRPRNKKILGRLL